MAAPTLRSFLLSVATIGVCAPAFAQDIVPNIAGPAFAEQTGATANGSEVLQTAYAGLATSNTLPTPLPPGASVSVMAGPTYIPPANATAQSPTLAPGEVVYSNSADWDCPPMASCRTSSWTAGVELLPMEAHVSDFEFGRRDEDDAGFGVRAILGYENPRGFGIRGRFSGFGQETRAPAGDVTLNAGTFQLDTYKRVFFEDDTELALGFGPASGVLEFELDDSSHADFEGAGITLFAESFWPGIHFQRSELGIVGRARYNLFFGHWNSNDPILIPATDGDTMSAVELAWGFEFRRRFGRCDDHHWYIGLLLEYQRWQSDWMSNFGGTSVGLSGLNVNTGLVW